MKNKRILSDCEGSVHTRKDGIGRVKVARALDLILMLTTTPVRLECMLTLVGVWSMPMRASTEQTICLVTGGSILFQKSNPHNRCLGTSAC